ncbi:MAG: hypothetical protein OXU64_03100 [Gemmatimonadota bacterium]|nr:hypothetical protein [Gemmatimonadota bacterium]
MVEAQQFVEHLLMQMDQAGGLAGLALGFTLGFTLGLITGLIIVYDALAQA